MSSKLLFCKRMEQMRLYLKKYVILFFDYLMAHYKSIFSDFNKFRFFSIT